MYHIIGIKGSGTSALAQILFQLGYAVQGSDYDTYFFTEEKLRELNIPILPFSKENIKEGLKIVKSAAYDETNVEVARAKELNIPVFSYNEVVGSLTKKFKTICVAGCHGKTTTTSMLAHVLDNLIGVNYLIGDATGHANPDNEMFVLESCEYRRHFLEYNPYYTIITNVELDHVDYYKDINDVILAYQEFANKTEKVIVACGDDRYTRFLEVNKPIFYYGIDDDNDIVANEIEYKETGTSFDVIAEGNYYGHFDLPIYGKAMLLDALATISICYYERLEAKAVAHIFKTYGGARRRFSQTILENDVIIDDYAHHPTEIRAIIRATKQKFPNKTLVAIFEPHTFSRTDEFKTQIGEALNLADYQFILPIHPSREVQSDFEGITSNIVCQNTKNGKCITVKDAKILNEIKDAVFLFMSPNDVSNIEKELIELKQSIETK